MNGALVGLAVAGPVVVAAAWTVSRRGRASVWAAMGAASGTLGLLSLLVGRVRVAAELPAGRALLLGVVAGVALYAATAAFLALARGWTQLVRHSADLYGRREGLSLPAAVALATGVVAVGEELLWRGAVQGAAQAAWGPVPGALAAWAAYVAANLFSGSVPIALGAVVGGAVWGALAAWTGGVGASLACHAVWTGLMVAIPPLARSPLR